jgi:hypothetical protein
VTEAAGLDDVKTGAVAQSPNDLGGYSIMQAESKEGTGVRGDGGQTQLAPLVWITRAPPLAG